MSERSREMFQPPDKQEQLKGRVEALKSSIQEKSKLKDVLTEEAKAMATEAVNLLESIDISSPDAVGKIALLEAALNVQPQVLREKREI